MIGLQRIEVEGKRFVLLEEGQYERLCREAGETPTERSSCYGNVWDLSAVATVYACHRPSLIP